MTLKEIHKSLWDNYSLHLGEGKVSNSAITKIGNMPKVLGDLTKPTSFPQQVKDIRSPKGYKMVQEIRPTGLTVRICEVTKSGKIGITDDLNSDHSKITIDIESDLLQNCRAIERV